MYFVRCRSHFCSETGLCSELRSTEWARPAGWQAGERHRLVSQSSRLWMLAVGNRCQHSDAQPAVSGAVCSRRGKIDLKLTLLYFFNLMKSILIIRVVIPKTMVCFSFICSHARYLHFLSRAVSKCHGHRMINCIFYADWHPELKAAGGLIGVVSGGLHDPDLVFLFYCIITDRPHSDYFGREGQPRCLQDLPKGKMKAMNSIKKLVNSSIMVNIAG